MDLERTMTFIVEQQAKFEADIAKINVSLTSLNETAKTHNEAIRGLVESSRVQGIQAERNSEAIRDLVEVSRLQSERVDRLDQGLAQMAEAESRLTRAQEETDRRLADFVAQVSRYLAGGNGRKRRPGAPGTK